MANQYGCGCTGIRGCSMCQKLPNYDVTTSSATNVHWFCPKCEKIFSGNIDDYLLSFDDRDWCERHDTQPCSMSIEGIRVTEGFIDDGEECLLIDNINRDEWKVSQSGRRKQDYGPKANFKRKKLKVGSFTGLPGYCKFLVERMKAHDWLCNFHAVELCNLEYTRQRGSSIDPHIDDTWLWGDVLVTVNLKSHTILTLSMNQNSSLMRNKNNTDLSIRCENNDDSIFAADDVEIQIPMPRKSLLLLSKDARYSWLHSIQRRHIQDDRYAMTLRNLSKEFSENGPQWEIGKTLIDIANTFEGSIVL